MSVNAALELINSINKCKYNIFLPHVISCIYREIA